MLNNKNLLITGGTGSFGSAFIEKVSKIYKPKKIIIFSRDELKQSEMQKKIKKSEIKKFRFFIGDVRDKERVHTALKEVDVVIHAAALKQVDAAEYNPLEAVKTNIIGAENIISASISNNVEKIIALSTDKACSPINLYGATKLVSDKLFISANNVKGKTKCKFSVLRYGNVMGSRGSVIPLFLQQKKNNEILTITDLEMTRFSLTIDDGINFAIKTLGMMTGGEIFVPKIPSYKMVDLITAIGIKYKIIGMRPGEKKHEDLISVSDALQALETEKFYIISPNTKVAPWEKNKFMKHNKLKKLNYVKKGFSYSSSNNKNFLSAGQIKNLIKKNLK
jgi:UDP-N-acetylglucosamine 4,6-dehydratase